MMYKIKYIYMCVLCVCCVFPIALCDSSGPVEVLKLNNQVNKALNNRNNKTTYYDFPQSRAFINSSSVNANILAASKCICKKARTHTQFIKYNRVLSLNLTRLDAFYLLPF